MHNLHLHPSALRCLQSALHLHNSNCKQTIRRTQACCLPPSGESPAWFQLISPAQADGSLDKQPLCSQSSTPTFDWAVLVYPDHLSSSSFTHPSPRSLTNIIHSLQRHHTMPWAIAQSSTRPLTDALTRPLRRLKSTHPGPLRRLKSTHPGPVAQLHTWRVSPAVIGLLPPLL